jgi:site-specific recombinase XerD
MSISINAVIRKDKINRNNHAPINIRLTLKSKNRYVGTGVNVALISESLRHSDLATTQIYLDSFENRLLDEAMKNLL